MFGKRVRAIRQRKRISLSELARRAGISKSHLSLIERGASTPSVETVQQIANALGVPPFTLFIEDSVASGVVRRDQRRRLQYPASDLVLEVLTPRIDSRMLLLETVIEPGRRGTYDVSTHEGEECVVVLSGSVTVQVGEETVRLHDGDSLYFDATLPHMFINDGTEPCRLIVAISPPLL